ncbi:transposase [Pandoraea sputorum]|uniref:Transposase n=2 Tax=Pandoraea sputorum TaxID=93222 RepID=A0A5E5BKW2_9BURK|nr:transposase [Pandoraea sputorum]
MALYESHGLVDEALHGWCRERGLFAHHLAQWRADFCAGGAAVRRRESAQDVRGLKQTNVALQRELKRTETALAEAAALLVLQKNTVRCSGTRPNDLA